MRLTSNPLAIIGQRAGYETSAKRAEALGNITRSYLLRVESGRQMPSRAIIERMAEVYGRTPDDIYRAAMEGCKTLARRMLEQYT